MHFTRVSFLTHWPQCVSHLLAKDRQWITAWESEEEECEDFTAFHSSDIPVTVWPAAAGSFPRINKSSVPLKVRPEGFTRQFAQNTAERTNKSLAKSGGVQILLLSIPFFSPNITSVDAQSVLKPARSGRKTGKTFPLNWQSDDDKSTLLYGGRRQLWTGKVDSSTKHSGILRSVWSGLRTTEHTFSQCFPKAETMVNSVSNCAFTAGSKHLHLSNLHTKTKGKKSNIL